MYPYRSIQLYICITILSRRISPGVQFSQLGAVQLVGIDKYYWSKFSLKMPNLSSLSHYLRTNHRHFYSSLVARIMSHFPRRRCVWYYQGVSILTQVDSGLIVRDLHSSLIINQSTADWWADRVHLAAAWESPESTDWVLSERERTLQWCAALLW